MRSQLVHYFLFIRAHDDWTILIICCHFCFDVVMENERWFYILVENWFKIFLIVYELTIVNKTKNTLTTIQAYVPDSITFYFTYIYLFESLRARVSASWAQFVVETELSQMICHWICGGKFFAEKNVLNLYRSRRQAHTVLHSSQMKRMLCLSETRMPSHWAIKYCRRRRRHRYCQPHSWHLYE